MNTVVEKLIEARGLIERGWTQGAYACDNRQTGSLCYCLYGAIQEAVTGNPFNGQTDATVECDEYLALAIGRDRLELSEWNDAPERSQADVIAAFDRAIELARGEGE